MGSLPRRWIEKEVRSPHTVCSWNLFFTAAYHGCLLSMASSQGTVTPPDGKAVSFVCICRSADDLSKQLPSRYLLGILHAVHSDPAMYWCV